MTDEFIVDTQAGSELAMAVGESGRRLTAVGENLGPVGDNVNGEYVPQHEFEARLTMGPAGNYVVRVLQSSDDAIEGVIEGMAREQLIELREQIEDLQRQVVLIDAGHAVPVPDIPEADIPVLSCAACNIPIVSREELLIERATTLESAVFSYELDMLDREYWAYSATNPGAVRFDVVRTVPVPHIILSGRPSPDHSWFPPFEWRMAHCCCGAHLGWSFTSPSRTSAYNLFLRTEVARIKAAQPELSHRDAFREAARNFRVEDHLGQSHGFHGLIVTNLRERRATAEQLHNRERLAADRLRTTRRIDSMMRVLFNEAAEEAQRTADDEGEEEGEDVEDEGEEEGEEEGEVGGEQAAHTSAAEHIGALLAAQADGNEPH
eukprot:jgi/Chrpa1/12900/Chrysochromulina_OHIO_Genome00019512-RA